MSDIGPLSGNMRIGVQALFALQSTAESYIMNMMQSTQAMAITCGRITITQKHMAAVQEQRMYAKAAGISTL